MTKTQIKRALAKAKKSPTSKNLVLQDLKSRTNRSSHKGDIEIAVINHLNGLYPERSAIAKIQEAIKP